MRTTCEDAYGSGEKGLGLICFEEDIGIDLTIPPVILSAAKDLLRRACCRRA
ncbi:MAG: hypothetical protein ACHQIM_08825 [Sphingobacteriales bacterium]